jgi:hypothetical protein
MTLLDEAINLQRGTGAACSVSIVQMNDPKLYAELIEGLASTVQASALSRALKERGCYISGDRLTAHRRGECVQCRS